jgi:hypothetical protein
MADKVYKEPMQATKNVSPELVEVAEAEPQELLEEQKKLCTCGGRENSPTLAETIRKKVAAAQAEELPQEHGSEISNEKIWTSVYDFNGPGKFADDHRFRKWWDRSGRQLFNLIYFALGGVACYVISQTSGYLYKTSMVGLCLFAAIVTAAAIYAICQRRPSQESDVFSERTKKIIRGTALSAPLLAMVVAGWNCLTYGVDYLWTEGLYPGYNSHMSQASYDILKKEQVEVAASISPLNTEVAKRHFERTKLVGSYELAVKMADKVIRFNRHDSRWKIRRLGVLGRLPEREQEFQTLTNKYKKRYGRDGYLWNTLADTAVYNKDWPLALDMANEHVKRHEREAIAYEQRASIFKNLGMEQEAEEDLVTANSFSNSGNH